MSNKNNINQKIISLVETFNQKKYDDVIQQSNKLLIKGYKIAILYNLIGASYSFKNDHIKAINFYNKSLDLNFDNEEILRNLGKSLVKTQQYDEAIKVFEKSIKLKPNNVDSFFSLGFIYLQKGKYLESIDNFKKTAELKNDKYEVYYNLGVVYDLLGNLDESKKNYILAIKLNNKYAIAINNLATIFIRQKKYKEAVKTLQMCLSIEPNFIQALTNLGVAYQGLKKFKDAINSYDNAIAIQPNFPKALVQKLFLKRKFCNWSNEVNDNNEFKIINNSMEEITPWPLLCLDDSARDEYERAKKYSKQFRSLRKKTYKSYKNKKIKIGYFTPDFHDHAGMKNLEGVFKYHDRSKFEIIAFDYGYNNNDETHNSIKKYFDKFYYVFDFSDKEIADLSIENKIDIGIHRNGYAQHSRPKIFSYNSCLVQINYLGYPGTTASDSIDYIIADKIVIPDAHKKFYSEKIIYMPDSFYPAYDQKKISKKKYKREEFGIPDNAFVLSSFNNSYKISSEEFSIWMKIMSENSSTYLLLLIKDTEARKNLLFEIYKYKIDIKRIIFLDYINIEEHLSRHSLADLFLDTFNYNAHTTAVEALCTGLPIVTKIGNSFSARVCASILNAFEIPELITDTNQTYYKMINKLINNKVFYNDILLRSKKNAKKSKLFNSRKYVRNLEKAFEKSLKMKLEENKVDDIFVEN